MSWTRWNLQNSNWNEILLVSCNEELLSHSNIENDWSCRQKCLWPGRQKLKNVLIYGIEQRRSAPRQTDKRQTNAIVCGVKQFSFILLLSNSFWGQFCKFWENFRRQKGHKVLDISPLSPLATKNGTNGNPLSPMADAPDGANGAPHRHWRSPLAPLNGDATARIAIWRQ